MNIAEQTIDCMAQLRLQAIREATDSTFVTGTRYYVSAQGSDENDGLTPATAWKTMERINQADLQVGDGVFFRRGDVFRGGILATAGVTYAAYGEGEKPRLYGWKCDLADPALWSLADAAHKIWKYRDPILDVGTLVFNHGEACGYKLIPSYIGGTFVCRDRENVPFDMAVEMRSDLDLYWHYADRMTEMPTKGESFPIPVVDDQSFGTLYLRCDRGNPGEVFASIEALPRKCMFRIGAKENVHIDNLCIRYVGHHAISAGGHSRGLHVTNCEIGWIGGTIQHYYGTDPNYPKGRRGTVTRFGNAVEIYGGCEDYLVENCYIYQCYDAGITHQITTNGKNVQMQKIRYRGNLVERCVYSIEYFLEMNGGDTQSLMSDIVIEHNILRLAGYGWGQQRHNVNTPAHIKGWSYENRAQDFFITDNVFDRSAYRLLHLVAGARSSCPVMHRNTYIQYTNGMLGQYGGKENGEPPVLMFDGQAAQTVASVFGDGEATVRYDENRG